MKALSYKGILCDIGGVLHVDGTPIEGAVATLKTMKAHYPVRLLTNSTQKRPEQIAANLQRMGFEIEPHELITALDMTKNFLKRHQSSGYYILTDDAKAYFNDLNHLPKRYVVVGDAQQNFSYDTLNQGFRELINGSELIAAVKNRYFKVADNLLSMDAGGFIAALEYAAKKEAHIIGKPSPEFFRFACASMGVSPQDTVMIGDDIEGDIEGAQQAGLKAVLVKTGKFTPEDLHIGITPDLTVDSLSELFS